MVPPFQPKSTQPKKRKPQRYNNLASGSLINSASGVPRYALSASPITPSAKCAFRYSETLSLTSSSVAARLAGTQHEFRLNSIYDPDLSGTGHQPYMYDQFATLYGRYRVDFVEVQIDAIVSPSTSHLVTAMIQGPSGGQSASGKAMSDLLENVRCKNLYALTSAVTPPRTRFSIDIAKYLGIPREAYEADLSLWGAAVGANPSRTLFMNLATSAFAGTSETIQVVVTMVFHTHLWDPVTHTQS